MHPDAELGRRRPRLEAVDPADAQFVLALAEKRHNPKVNAALAEGDARPGRRRSSRRRSACRGRRDGPAGHARSKLKRLRETTDQPIDVETVKEAGRPGRFGGTKSRSRSLGILVAGLAETRQDVAKLYDLPAAALRPDATAGGAPKVAFIKVDGVIEPVLEQFVIRQIDRAVAGGANLILFEIESPGGLLLSQPATGDAYHCALDAKQGPHRRLRSEAGTLGSGHHRAGGG